MRDKNAPPGGGASCWTSTLREKSWLGAAQLLASEETRDVELHGIVDLDRRRDARVRVHGFRLGSECSGTSCSSHPIRPTVCSTRRAVPPPKMP